MIKEWTFLKLGDTGKIITGKTPSTKNELNFGIDYPFITPADLQQGKNIVLTERYLSRHGVSTVAQCIIPPNSICVSCIGNLGYVAKTTQESVTNQQINSIVPKEGFDHDFLYYAIVGKRNFFKQMEGQSTTISILNKTQFSNIQIAQTKGNNLKINVTNVSSGCFEITTLVSAK